MRDYGDTLHNPQTHPPPRSPREPIDAHRQPYRRTGTRNSMSPDHRIRRRERPGDRASARRRRGTPARLRGSGRGNRRAIRRSPRRSPSASSTSITRIRVPATIGRPPQTSGSMTMRSLIPRRCAAGGGSAKGYCGRAVLVPYPLGRGRGGDEELFEGSARTTALPLDGGGISQLESEAN